MAESTGMEAVTVHRLLDYRPFGSSLICKDAANPIDADLIVVDEMSMMNIELFDLFLEAVKTGTTLILVGDINQLEAVGPGAVLQDLLEAPSIPDSVIWLPVRNFKQYIRNRKRNPWKRYERS